MGNNELERDLNTKVNWILYGTGPLMVEAFKQGNLDIGYMGLPPALIGIDNNVPIKCVAGGHVEGTIMIAKKDYKDMNQLDNNMAEVLSQFKGKLIGVTSKGYIHEVILSHFLKKYDLSNDVEVKNYGQAEFIALNMKKGILDAGVGTHALAVFASTILNSHIIIEPKHLWANNPSYGVFFHENLIENYPEIIIEFLNHHKKASYLLRNSQSLAAEKISKTFEIIDKNYAESVLKISPKYCISLSEDYINATIEFVKTLKNLNYIKNELTPENIFDPKFIRKVHPEQDHYSI